MFETSKATKRRHAEEAAGGFPWSDIVKGDVLDVGPENDPLVWQGATVTEHQLPDGGGDDLTDSWSTNWFDCIHGSQVLEHAIDPAVMLRSWLACLKPGGYIVATVPSWVLYEKQTWPSKWNAGHKSIWTIDWHRPPTNGVDVLMPHNAIICFLPGWLDQFKGVEMLRCKLIDTNYDDSFGPDVDQTLDPSKGVECFIELCLRRLP